MWFDLPIGSQRLGEARTGVLLILALHEEVLSYILIDSMREVKVRCIASKSLAAECELALGN